MEATFLAPWPITLLCSKSSDLSSCSGSGSGGVLEYTRIAAGAGAAARPCMTHIARLRQVSWWCVRSMCVEVHGRRVRSEATSVCIAFMFCRKLSLPRSVPIVGISPNEERTAMYPLLKAPPPSPPPPPPFPPMVPSHIDGFSSSTLPLMGHITRTNSLLVVITVHMCVSGVIVSAPFFFFPLSSAPWNFTTCAEYVHDLTYPANDAGSNKRHRSFGSTMAVQ